MQEEVKLSSRKEQLKTMNDFIYSNSPRELPNLSNYDVVGFDADHCVVKYHLHALTKHIATGAVNFIYERFSGYPEEYKQFAEEEFDFPLNGTIVDKDKGVVLKLSEDKDILRAFYGFTRLSDQQIASKFGADKKWDFDESVLKNQDYQSIIGYFDTGILLAYTKGVHYKKKRLVEYSHRDMWEHIRAYVYGNWANADFEKKQVNHIAEFAGFFPALVKQPLKFIRHSPDFRAVVESLRAKGVKVFLATNSHHEFSNLIMSTSFGADWKSLFDVICEYCMKPTFFTGDNKFHLVDTSKPLYEGDVHQNLQKGQEYIYGNRKHLELFFEKQCGKKDLKYLFVGDNYFSDCMVSGTFSNWESCAIVEELQLRVSSPPPQPELPLLNYQKAWGDYFSQTTDKGTQRTFFVGYLEKHTRLAVPLISWLKDLIN